MTAKRGARRWTGNRTAGGLFSSGTSGEGAARPAKRRDREGRLVEVLLEVTTIAGLFALLFALLVVFGAAHTLTP